jgi:hypothetical protein
MIHLSIKILTFHRAINYGAVLQTYALYTFISKEFPTAQVSVYDYYCAKIENIYRFKIWHNNLKTSISELIKSYPNYLKRKRMLKFIYSHVRTEKDFKESDSFIVGSDQVWNYDCTNFDKAFFLNFIKNKKNKNAYAASFGIDKIPNEYINEYRSLLKSFNHISIREKVGADIIADLLNRDVPVLLDPTLLLPKQEWDAIRKDIKPKRPYILVYAFNITHTMRDFINRLAKEERLDVIILMPMRPLIVTKSIKKAKYLSACSPEEWISYFMDATYVVTNSFHGIAFSINFNKNFFAELLPPPAKVNSRIVNILNKFDLNDRVIEQFLTNKEDKRINYDNINQILEIERRNSYDYIKTVIEDSNEQN